MKKFLLFISFCLLCLSQIGATDVAVDFSTAGYTDKEVVTKDVSTDANISIVFAKASAGTAPTYYANGTAIRLYNGGTLTVSAKSGYQITGISFTHASGNSYIQYLTVSTGNGSFSYTDTNGTYTTSGDNEVVFTQVKNGKNTTQSRIISITVTYEEPTKVETPTTTAADKMLYGAEFTISTSTEGAILMYNLNGSDETYASAEGSSITLNAPTKGESFTIKAYAVDPNNVLTQSETLTKTVTLYAPTPAEAVFKIGENEVTGGYVYKDDIITCSWENGNSAKITINNGEPIEINADDENYFPSYMISTESYEIGSKISVKVVVKNQYNVESTASTTFTVANPTKVAVIDNLVDDITSGSGYTTFSGVIKNGAEYAGRFYKNTGIQLNSNSNGFGSAIFMTQSVGKVTKIILNIKSSSTGKTYVFGKDTPYVEYSANETTKPSTDEAYAYNSDESKIGKAIETEIAAKEEPYVIENPGYNYIIIVSNGVVVFNSITFEWEDGFISGFDITYEMQSEATKLTAGKFVTLVDTTNGKAVSRNNAAEGTIASTDATVEDNTLKLAKGQFSIDEFELVPVAEGCFKLYGGTLINRRYIGYDETGLTTTAKETEAAVVTLESDGKGVVVKFTNGDIIVSDGTNFGKGKASTESATSLAEGATLVPAYVFVSGEGVSTGVEDIEMVETEAPAQYYNLNGVEVKAGNLVPGIYIVRQGNKVSKQFIR